MNGNGQYKRWDCGMTGGKHSKQEATDSTHYTYESHIACSIAMERFATKLFEMQFTTAGHLAKQEAKEYYERAEEVRTIGSQEIAGGDLGTSAPTQHLQAVADPKA